MGEAKNQLALKSVDQTLQKSTTDDQMILQRFLVGAGVHKQLLGRLSKVRIYELVLDGVDETSPSLFADLFFCIGMSFDFGKGNV